MTTAHAPLPCPSLVLPRPARHPSLRSRLGLCATGFFLAEIGGAVVPFLSKHLVERGWSDGNIGVAISLLGLSVYLMQTPAGFLVDRLRRRRALFAGASIVVGLSLGLAPLVPAWRFCLDPLLFLAGSSQAFLAPLVGALALGSAGHAGLNRLMGAAQSCDHAGNLASALEAIALLPWLPVASIFYAVAAVSVLAVASVFLIRPGEVDDAFARGGTRRGHSAAGFLTLLRDRRVAILFAAVALFHLANAP